MSTFAGFIRPKAMAFSSDEAGWTDVETGRPSAAGIRVTADNALSAGAVFACVRNLAEDLAKLPLILYQRNGEAKSRATTDPLFVLLHDAPNEEMTSFGLRCAVTGLALLRGNGYCEITRKGGNQVTSLLWLDSRRVTPKRSISSRLYYEIRSDTGTARKIMPDSMLHIPGFTTDGIAGLMLASLGSQTIGLNMALERFAATFFGNGAIAGTILKHPGKLSPAARKNLADSYDVSTRGSGSHSTIVLEEGITSEKVSVDAEASQFVETRQFSVEDVARWFRMPPHKIGHLLRAAGWSTLEATNADYITDTLQPWAVRWEQEIKRKLLLDRDDMFVEHLFEAMMRGDTLARAQANQIKWERGILSADEWRAQDNMNPLPDDMGRTYFVPMNMTPLDRALEEPEPEPSAPAIPPTPPVDDSQEDDESDGQADARARRAGMRLFAEAARRLLRKEHMAMSHIESRGGDTAGVQRFYADHGKDIQAYLIVPAMALGDMLAGPDDAVIESIEQAVTAYSVRHIKDSLSDVESRSSGERQMHWTTDRPAQISRLLVEQITAAVAVAAGAPV